MVEEQLRELAGETLAHASSDGLIAQALLSSMSGDFLRIGHKFDIAYSMCAVVHWYAGEGSEECKFSEAHKNLAA